MKSIKIISSLILISLLFLAIAMFVPAEYFVARSSKEIDYYGDATRLKLRRFEITGLPREVRSWLEGPHDGAFGTVIAINFISWGLSHPDDFVYIVEGLDPKRKNNVVDWLGGMVEEMLAIDEFLSTFENYNSPVIVDLKTTVRASRR